jgi:prophage tail gpP-like protein
VGGQTFVGWTGIQITASIENAARSFAFAASDLPGGRRIAPWSPCEVLVGDDLVVSGFVERVEVAWGPEEHAFSVSGRSKTGQLVDCSAIVEPGQWKGRRLEDIAAAIAAPYGVEVVTDVDTGEAIPSHRTQPGESAFEAIERAARPRALLVTDDAQGRCLLTRAGAQRASTPLEQPGNVKSGAAVFDGQERFTEYVCKGQRTGDDQDFGAAVAEVEGTAADAIAPLRRVLLLQASGPVSTKRAAQQAAWEAAQRAGRSTQVSVVVQGWRQRDGSLWSPNQVVPVRLGLAGLDAELLVVQVTFSLDDSGGRVASLLLAPVGGYELLAPAERGKAGKKALDKGLIWEELNP